MSSPILLHMNGPEAIDQLRRLSHRNSSLEQALAELRQEVTLLTVERDELIDVLRDRMWATPEERMELLVDHELTMLRHELAIAKGERPPARAVRAPQPKAHQGRRCA